VARRCAPSLVHALVDSAGGDVAMLGAALAQHLTVPLVLEVAADPGPATTPDAMRSEAALTDVLSLADRVITADAAMRDRLIGRGLPEGHVAVVPVGGDLPALYAAVTPGSVATVGA
jgi:glycosyl transferase family 4